MKSYFGFELRCAEEHCLTQPSYFSPALSDLPVINRYGIFMRWKQVGTGNPLGLVPGKPDPAPRLPDISAQSRSDRGRQLSQQVLTLLQYFELNDHEGVPLAFRSCPRDGPSAFLRHVDSIKEKLEALLAEVEALIGCPVDKLSLGLVPPRMAAEEEGEDPVSEGEQKRRLEKRTRTSGGYCRFVRCYKNKRPAPAFSGLPQLLYNSRRAWLLLEAAQLVREGRAASWSSSASSQSQGGSSQGGSSKGECSERSRSSGAESLSSRSEETEVEPDYVVHLGSKDQVAVTNECTVS